MSALHRALGAALVLAASATGAAQAQEASKKWFVHAGPAIVAPDESAKVTAGGALVPGGSVSIKSRWTFEGEVGRFVTPNVAVAVAGGWPPKFTMNGAGALAGLTAGKVTGGPAGVFLQYHFNPEGRIRAHVGAGAAILVVFKEQDIAVTKLNVKNAIGPGIGGGVDLMLNDTWGLFGDVKKAWIKTTATGMLGPAPVRARVTLDPLVINAGAAYHF